MKGTKNSATRLWGASLMKGNGWKIALPVFLLSATLSTAVLAAGGLGLHVLGRAVPGIAPAPNVSPFAVVDGGVVTLPGQVDTEVSRSLLALDRIPQPAPRSADTPPRPRRVSVAGETVPVEVPEPAPRVRGPRQPRDEAPARSDGDAHRDDDDAPAEGPAPQDEGKNGKTPQGDDAQNDAKPGKAQDGNGAPGQAQGNGNANGTPDDTHEDEDHRAGRSGRDDEDKDGGERRVHAASADGNGTSGGGSGSGSADGARNGRTAR